MAGNTFGKLFTLTTFGESHGFGYGGIIDGCPPGLSLNEQDIQHDLNRRRPGQSRLTTQRREKDIVKIMSGVFEGKTTGTPIGLFIENQNHRLSDYVEIKNKFRPGHADFTYYKKYGIRDYRGGGRASARETMLRVAAGAIARKYLLETCNIKITGHVSKIGHIEVNVKQQIEQFITQLRREGDSIGAKITIIADNVPIGLGEPVFNGLDADIAHAMMSINAVKGVEIGAGFASIEQRGSQHRDEITPHGFLSNNAGGILGGISTGQALIVNIALKPTSSILIPGRTVTLDNQATEIITKGRHDPCVGIRGVPVAESMLALVLIDHLLRHRAQNWYVAAQ